MFNTLNKFGITAQPRIILYLIYGRLLRWYQDNDMMVIFLVL